MSREYRYIFEICVGPNPEKIDFMRNSSELPCGQVAPLRGTTFDPPNFYWVRTTRGYQQVPTHIGRYAHGSDVSPSELGMLPICMVCPYQLACFTKHELPSRDIRAMGRPTVQDLPINWVRIEGNSLYRRALIRLSPEVPFATSPNSV